MPNIVAGGCNHIRAFRLGDLFEHIEQGKRLKKEDHISGNFPFVMSGTTNTGLVAHIANPVNRFPKDSITIDIFGNVFYRGYEYSASDDVGVYWNDKKLSHESLLYIVSVLSKNLLGRYSYSKKLRASQSLGIQIGLPVTSIGEPDYDFMEKFIRIQQKLAIKNVVDFLDKNIAATKQIVG